MTQQQTFLVFGATGQTGRHFVSLALSRGDRIRAVVRDPSKVHMMDPDLEIQHGSITDPLDLDELVQGTDAVIAMLGDTEAQRATKVNTAFIQQLAPAMRRQGVHRLLYQAGALSTPPDEEGPLALRTIRRTLPRGYAGQHEDNEAVMRYLADEASDLNWVAHRAGIGSNGPSKGTLERTGSHPSIATFRDCAEFNYRTIRDDTISRGATLSRYRRGEPLFVDQNGRT